MSKRKATVYLPVVIAVTVEVEYDPQREDAVDAALEKLESDGVVYQAVGNCIAADQYSGVSIRWMGTEHVLGDKIDVQHQD